MPYLGVLEAVKARLEGQPFQFVPPLPGRLLKPDINIADSITPNDRAEVPNQTALGISRIGDFSVPIFRFDVEGQPWADIYPAFTFYVMDIRPRFDEYVFQPDNGGADAYMLPVVGSEEHLTDTDGTDLGITPRMAQTRGVEQPLDIMFEIRAYADDDTQAALLLSHIYRRFPPRHFMRIPMEDGTWRSWDMFFVDYKDLTKREGVEESEDTREYLRVFTYRLEAYLDNTGTAEFVNLVRKRIINSVVVPNVEPQDDG